MGHATAGYFDGVTSARHEVQLFLEKNTLRIHGDDVSLSYPLSTVKVAGSVGSVIRTIKLPDDGVCEVTNADFIADLEKASNRPLLERWIPLWEKNLSFIFAGLVLLGVVIAVFLRYGVPFMAYHVAFAIPQGVEATIGRDALTTLDKIIFKPSTVKEERRKELAVLFRRVNGVSGGGHLEFRSCPAMGANAIALPSGIIVMTDSLVELAENDDELAAVLAHEIGHARLRHGLRHVLQNSVTVLIISTLTGDLLSVASFSAALPTALVDASFSRAFEREADDAAMAWMQSAGVDPKRYAEILARMEAHHNNRNATPDAGKKFENYFSSHPDTQERIKRILQ
ncbi:MAG: M48 family metallopeptidase [Pseudomonadota bacterium]